ncbi:MAG: hypothetical protein A2148_10580 [Chloroflexi bacterium RBG_16_68_14]|nr:MAG: hypothetical protein A2148_10580 [Chloroflexi bacterium RBG_16_68_14]
MRDLRVLMAVILLATMVAAFGWSGTIAGQEPPVGNPPEPDDDLQQQIAQLLLESSSQSAPGGTGIEEDPQLWDLIKQQQPDLTVTLGGEPVGGVAEPSDVKGTPLQLADSTGPNVPLIVGIAVGLPALGGIAWYIRRRVARES